MITETNTHDGTVDLGWLMEALDYARSNEQARVVDYLQSVADDVVFEMESASRRI